ncbi:response regulator transcription factor [Methylocucumis oryzae]|uniref:response regulator transcription factor n=1 Tax=Methylocucumis oryzae TaxID=1632867 RepID=UPI000AAF6896|nr:response regulator transcription factor [Methylocucumis oryzae]
MKRLLIIEDDIDIGDMLDINLRDENFMVELATDGLSGLHKLKSQTYDLLVLDLMLPGLDGLEICRQVRLMPNYLPIIIISAKAQESQRVLGLELGADDYLGKPFSVPELAARIRALFRRINALEHSLQAKTGVLRYQDLLIDPIKHEVKLAGQAVTLTAKEFELLLFFARHPGKAFTRLALLDQVWGYQHDGYEHTVNSHINRLRGKNRTQRRQAAIHSNGLGRGL